MTPDFANDSDLTRVRACDDRVRAWLDRLEAHHEEKESLDSSWMTTRSLVAKLRRVLAGEESLVVAPCWLCKSEDGKRYVVEAPWWINHGDAEVTLFEPAAVCASCLPRVACGVQCLCGEALAKSEWFVSDCLRVFAWYDLDGLLVAVCPSCGVPLPATDREALAIRRDVLRKAGYAQEAETVDSPETGGQK